MRLNQLNMNKMSSMHHHNHEEHEADNHHQTDEHSHDAPIEDEEIDDWRRKLIGAWIFTIPIAFFMLSERLFGIEMSSMAQTTVLLLII